MSPKITPDHLARAALVYVRQSTLAQVVGNLESQRRQYALADLAKAAAWVNAQPDWPRLEVVGDFMRYQARDVIAAFPWSRTESRDSLEPPG